MGKVPLSFIRSRVRIYSDMFGDRYSRHYLIEQAVLDYHYLDGNIDV